MKRDLIVIGASAVALDVADISLNHGLRIEAFIDETLNEASYNLDLGRAIVNKLEPWIDDDSLDVVIAIGDNFYRQAVYERISSRVRRERFINLIHPDATVAHRATLGVGSILLAGCRVGPSATIGDFQYLNTNSVVAHHCTLGAFSSLNAGATLGGRVSIGPRSSIGMNASVRERCRIGDDVIVGANSFVNSDAPSNTVLGGVPARVLRRRSPGDPYLK